MSMGPGWYEDQYVKTLGKLSDGPINFGPSYDPQKALAKQLIASLAKAYPGVSPAANHVYTFEALLVAADAYKRAGSTDPKALADAIRTTNITDNVGIGAGIQFNERGQNDKIKCAATQIQDGRTVTIAPNGDRERQADVADGALRQARAEANACRELRVATRVASDFEGRFTAHASASCHECRIAAPDCENHLRTNHAYGRRIMTSMMK